MSRQFVTYLLLALSLIWVEILFCVIAVLGIIILFRFFRETDGGQFLDTLYLIGAEALAFGLEALDGDKLLCVNLFRPSEFIGSTISDLDERIDGICQQDEFRAGIVAEPVLLFLRGIHLESFQIGIALIVGIEENGRPDVVCVVFLDAKDIGLKVVVQVETGQIIIAVVKKYENLVFVVELAKQLSVIVVVQTIHVRIIPYFSSTKGRVPVTLQADAVYGIFCQQITLRAPAFDPDLREVLIDENVL